MRHSSKVSACRRRLNTDKAAGPRAPSQSLLPAEWQATVESSLKEQAPVPPSFTNSPRCIGQRCRARAAGLGQARGSVANMVCACYRGHLKLLQESVPRYGLQRAAAGVRRGSSRAKVLYHPPRRCPPRAALPNPSLKPSPNSVARRPSSAGPAAHSALAVQRATLSVPA